MTASALTPYDTGERLQPRLWEPTSERETFGRVDFEDNEERTVFGAHVDLTPAGYVLRLTNLYDPLTIDVDDARTLVVSDDLRAGVEALLAFAERGYEKFQYQAEHGDHSPQDQAIAADRWALAQQAQAAILDNAAPIAT